MVNKMKKSLFIILSFFLVLFMIGCDLNNFIGASTKYTVVVNGPTTVEVGTNVSFSAVVEPKDTISQEVSWKVSNEAIATIDDKGALTALNVGRVAIIATSTVDSKASGKLYIKITEKEVVYTNEAPTAIELIGDSKAYVNGISLYSIKTIPSNASQSVIWTSSNEEIASVNNLGIVSFHKEGTVDITVKSSVDENILSKKTVEVLTLTKDNDVEQAVVDVIEKTKNSTLGVANYQYNERNVLVKASIGSGFVYDAWGYLEDGSITYNTSDPNIKEYGYLFITNRHVVKNSDELKIYMHTIDEEIPATLIQYDEKVDLAVVTFKYDEYICPLVFADSDTIKAGQFCISIGNPEGFDFSSSATLGIVSYPLRYISDDTDDDGVNDWDAAYIQHDAAINPGNSGGPLFNIYGQVIGINTMKFATNDIDNMGFSIPSNDIIELLPYLEKGKTPVRARIGVTVADVNALLTTDWQSAEYQYKIPEGLKIGLYVTEVVESSVAYGKIFADDIIIEFNGIKLKSSLQLRAELGAIVVGSNTEVLVKVLRNGQEVTVTLVW